MQHAKGRTGDCPGPRKETATQQNVTQGRWALSQSWTRSCNTLSLQVFNVKPCKPHEGNIVFLFCNFVIDFVH